MGALARPVAKCNVVTLARNEIMIMCISFNLLRMEPTGEILLAVPNSLLVWEIKLFG
jgi:hypothetical protein